MVRLSYDVLRFLDELEAQGVAAPKAWLQRLRQLARDSWEGAWVALHAPIAPLTWEVRATLTSDSLGIGPVPLEFPKPVEIVGVLPTITPVSFAPAPPLVTPTLDDVLISIMYDSEKKVTNSDEPEDTTGAGNQNFVTASAVGVLTPRLWGLRIDTPNPKLQAEWRWKQGPGVFVDSVVSICYFARYCGDGKR